MNTQVELTSEAPSSILIEEVSPIVDGGRYPIKREVGDRVDVQADIFREGHEHLLACIQYRPVDEKAWREVPMHFVDNDRWGGSFVVDRNTMWEYRVLAFPDVIGSWQEEMEKKLAAGVPVASELQEGVLHLRELLIRTDASGTHLIETAMKAAESTADHAAAYAILSSSAVKAIVAEAMPRHGAATSSTYRVFADRIQARYAAWYSLFPRSMGTEEGQSATFADVERQLPRIAGMGFDVLYFTPIHPISHSKRKGR
ncbi:MAG TPA: maltotransferase domain-containing protein, partial [Thermomicrobiales bacterium]|nr:maltotransferase domain-containing protein [Thermomicrobiales bacterium]